MLLYILYEELLIVSTREKFVSLIEVEVQNSRQNIHIFLKNDT